MGRPNVGKSTLLNAILGQKLAITTDRPGTTRTNVLGVYADQGAQIAFLDTPGILRPKTALHQVLQDQAEAALSSLDAVCFVVVASGKGKIHPEDQRIYERLRDAGTPIVVVVNKVDIVGNKNKILPLLEHWSNQEGVVATVPVSATEQDNLKALLDVVKERLPEGVLFEEDVLTDRPTRFFAAELIREAILRHVHAEVPYGVAVQLDRFLEEPERVRIDATIVVEKESHKGIVIGRGGERLKTIGIEARQAIEELVERPVVVKTWVKVHTGWTQDPRAAKELSQETDR